MGPRLSKQGFRKPVNLNIMDLHHNLINYLSRSLYIRNLVSKQRRRMLVGGYDLDMTYISDRILAMSFPAEHVRAMFRNPLWQVKSVLDMRHAGHYKVST
ncbi:phosphatidylinositol 3,4,5-trisphosphate 3-phosphatase and protein-tyrosine-phosphatase pten1 [Nicotiana attenuata]|uniref:Phosphatidylinositol 3,4,5-trisphosphate 3-phosphatase and protein-tyrosine-phosphatase pten1 n=1 Tax=Nicotiana attenuata TaxID=49451 RepID=A0A314L789_NICAT|nr:phosphatidylinositol 3,4,5-trisphosphate 3-phosphatase and protein-tyrosine-phosphatase pten1 [Nicotiana attenuata]